jgi:hypothetical protein
MDDCFPRAFSEECFETLVRANSEDTYDRALAETAGESVNDWVWLAQRGNATALLIFTAMTQQITDQVVAERWPGMELRQLRADVAVRVYREVRERLLRSSERHAWRWN